MPNRNEFGAFAIGFLVGGLAAGVAALLFAPQSGEETRELIKEKSIELRDQAQLTAEEAMARAEAFAADARAREVADRALNRRLDQEIPLVQRHFFFLPFEHSESHTDQERSVALFQAWAEAHDGPARDRALEQMRYVHRHAEIVERFGRFPHRNETLGRESTEAEIAFLKEPMSGF